MEQENNTLKFDNEYSRLIGAIGKAALVSSPSRAPAPSGRRRAFLLAFAEKKTTKKTTKQEKLQSNSVLVVGMKGLGLEIAKNIVLMGVKHLTIADGAPVQLRDLSSNFFLSEADVGKPRAQAVRAKLQELNDRCELKLHEGPVTEELVAQYRVVGASLVLANGFWI
jgi:molybdopterin/thiamine biosynthesis adenylyltransferase